MKIHASFVVCLHKDQLFLKFYFILSIIIRKYVELNYLIIQLQFFS
jgi:hypothetical protein